MTWVMFDYGGVICTPQPDPDVAAMAAVAGVSTADFAGGYWPFRPAYDAADLTAGGYWQAVAGHLGRSFTGGQIAELVRLDIASWSHLQQGTLEVISDIRAAGHRLAVLSNAPAEMARAVERMPLARDFEHLLFSCDLRAVKPDPTCFGKALSRLGAAPHEVTFIDDRAENVAAAARLGLRAIQFTGVPQLRGALPESSLHPGCCPQSELPEWTVR
jgi:putative hydrolase of the HAD superfamily